MPAGDDPGRRDDPAGDPARGLRAALEGEHGRPGPGDARDAARRRGRLRLRQQPARPGPGGGRARTRSTTRVRAGVHPAAVLRGQGPVPLGGAVGRSRRHPADRPRPCSSSSRRTTPCGAGSGWPRRRSRSRDFPPASAGSATASGRRPVSRSTSSCRTGEVSAPIVIGRDHLDAGSVASPNRETEAMADGIRRRRGLAAPERARQHGGRRHLGLDPPRRRCRDRLQPARRDGRRRRRHGPRGEQARAGPDVPTPGWA